MTEPHATPVEVPGASEPPVETVEEAPSDDVGVGPVTADDPQNPALYEPVPGAPSEGPPVESAGGVG